MEKEKLTYEEMISKLDSKGVKFTIITKEEAQKILKDNCNYFKLISYKKNYDKNSKGLYINLEFAYLYELSKIDRDIRYEILNLCLDIEHFLKLKLINDVCDKTNGYDPIVDFFTSNPEELEKINKHVDTSYTKAIIEKYSSGFPIWALCEVISFGSLLKFIRYYQNKYSKGFVDSRLLNNVRDLRNASAHNNCLIRNLKNGEIKPISVINKFISFKCTNISSDTRSKKLTNKFIYDFSCLIYMHYILVNDCSKFDSLKRLINNRFIENKDYFKTNNVITSSFTFIKKMLDNL